jgi:SAM-dependent methyltransferase
MAKVDEAIFGICCYRICDFIGKGINMIETSETDSISEQNRRLSRYVKTWVHGYRSTPAEEARQRQAQPNFLKKQGLLPHHVFLDLGCGYLRGTIDLVDYLEDGHFFGIDISQANIETARERALQQCRHKPNLATSSLFEIEQIWPNVRFDFILAASLFTHLWPADVEECLRQTSRVLRGKFFATIYKDNTVAVYDGWCGSCIDHEKRHSVNPMRRWWIGRYLNFCHNTSWIEQVARRSNLRVNELGSTEIGQFMLEIFPA